MMGKKVIEELNKDIEILNKENLSFPKNTRFKNGNFWVQWGEYQEWINLNIASISTIKDLVNNKDYRDSYILLRSLIESYLIIKLAMLGRVYFLDRTDKNKNESASDFLKRVKNDLKNEKNVIACKLIHTKGKDFKVKIRIIFNIAPVKDTSVFVPPHYFIAKDYDSDSQYLSELIIRNRWEGVSKTQIRERKKTNKKLRKDFLEMSSLYDFLKVNKFVTPRQVEAIRVHYAFLSKFVHSTIDGYGYLIDNFHSFEAKEITSVFKYNQYNELLILLYSNFISNYFLQLQLDYFSQEPDILMDDKRKRFLKNILKENNKKYSFFWFIYNKPHEFDIIHYIYKRYPKTKIYKKNPPVPYYTDPLARLRNLDSVWPNYTKPSILSE